jgi:ATP-dependent protease ClpP protease subunit
LATFLRSSLPWQRPGRGRGGGSAGGGAGQASLRDAGAGGQASDIEITVNEIRKVKKELYEIIALHTGQPVEKVAIDCDRDNWMTSTEAKEYGMVDEVLTINPRKLKKD